MNDLQKPTPLPVQLLHIPDNLKAIDRWILWRYLPKAKPDGTIHWRKVPFQGSGREAKSNTPTTWTDYGTAVDTLIMGCDDGKPVDGLGFVFTDTDNVAGIDLDDCIDPVTGEFSEVARELLERVDGYAEVSPSGTGIKLFTRAELARAHTDHDKGIEVYKTGRYFTVTGHQVNGHAQLPEAVQDVGWFIEKHFGARAARMDATPADAFEMFRPPLDGWDLERVETELLAHLDPDMGHSEWVKVGMAVHHQFKGDQEALTLWDRWSSGGTKYVEGECDDRWRSFSQQRFKGHGAVTLASVMAMAKQSRKTNDAPDRSARRGFALVQAGDLLVKPQQASYLIHDFVEDGALGAMLGAPGACKSFFALGMSACVATGTPFHGRSVRQGAVIYAAGEGHAGLGRRLKAWEIANGISLQDASLFITTMPVSLMEDESMRLVAQKVDEVAATHGPPALLIVDTLHRNAAGLEENSARDMGVVLGHIDELRERYGCAVVLVHHVGHVASDRARGSSSFRAALDFEYLMTVEGEHLRLTSTKSKEAESPDPVTFARVKVQLSWTDQNNDPFDSLVLQEVAAATKHRRHPKGAKGIALAALREAMAAIAPDELLSDNLVHGVPVGIWRDAAYRAGISDSDEPDTRAKAFRRARGELLDQGYVTCVNELYRSDD